MALLLSLPSHHHLFLKPDIFVFFKFIQTLFFPSRAQILWFFNELPFCSPFFNTHCYKVHGWTEKKFRVFSVQIGLWDSGVTLFQALLKLFIGTFWFSTPIFPPAPPKNHSFSYSIVIDPQIRKNHVNYDYDSNRFSVQTWRKKMKQKKEKNLRNRRPCIK